MSALFQKTEQKVKDKPIEQLDGERQREASKLEIEKPKPDEKSINHDILNYINSMVKQKYQPHAIKKQLISYGYKKDEVENSVNKILQETREHKGEKKELGVLQRFLIGVSAAILFLFITWIIAVASASPFAVILGFMPTVVTFVATILLLENHKKEQDYIIWSMPLVLAGLFYAIGTYSGGVLFANLDVGNLTSMNIIVSFTFVCVLQVIGVTRVGQYVTHKFQAEKKVEKAVKEVEKLHGEVERMEERQQSMAEYIQSIEDKCKAINFVIGRVYSGKHGGNKEIRARIQVDKELYNDVSEAKTNNPKGLIKAKRALGKIKHSLEVLDMREIDVFGDICYGFMNIKRNPSGGDLIIDILAKNDFDPVKIYVKSAKDFCIKALEALEKLSYV